MDHKRIGPVEEVTPKPTLRERVAPALHRVARAALAAVAFAFRPAALIALMLLAGGACAVAGVFILAGQAWALIAAAAILFTLAGLAMRGMLNG